MFEFSLNFIPRDLVLKDKKGVSAESDKVSEEDTSKTADSPAGGDTVDNEENTNFSQNSHNVISDYCDMMEQFAASASSANDTGNTESTQGAEGAEGVDAASDVSESRSVSDTSPLDELSEEVIEQLQTAETIYDEVVSGVQTLFPDNEELFVNYDYESIKEHLAQYIDESPVARDLYVKNENARLLYLSAMGELTETEYEKSARSTLYAIYPDTAELSEAERRDIQTKIDNMSAEDAIKLQDLILELPAKDSEEYEAKLTEFKTEFEEVASNSRSNSGVLSRSSYSDINSSTGGTVTIDTPLDDNNAQQSGGLETYVSFEDVFKNCYGIEYDAEKMSAYQEAKALYEVQLATETSRLQIHNILDNAETDEEIESGILESISGMAVSTSDEDLTTLLQNMTKMSNVSVKDGKIVADDLSKVKEQLLNTIDERAEELYSEGSAAPLSRSGSSADFNAATSKYESSYREAFGDKAADRTQAAIENDSSGFVQNLRKSIEAAGLTCGIGAMMTCNPVLLGVSIGCSVMAPGVELIAELTSDNPSQAKIDKLLGEMGLNAALAGFGMAAGVAGSYAGKVVSSLVNKGSQVFGFLADKATDVLASVMGNMVLTGSGNLSGELINQAISSVFGSKTARNFTKNMFEKFGFSAGDIKADINQAKGALSDDEVKWAEKNFKHLAEPTMEVYGEVINKVMDGEIIDKKGLNQIIKDTCEKYDIDDADDLNYCLEELMGKTGMEELYDCMSNMTPSQREALEDDYRDYAKDCIDKINEKLGIEPPHNDNTTGEAVDSDRGDIGNGGSAAASGEGNNGTKPVTGDDVNTENKTDDAGETGGVKNPDDEPAANNSNTSYEQYCNDVISKYKFSDENCVQYTDDILGSIKDKFESGEYKLSDIEKAMHDYLDDKSVLASDVRKMAQRIADELNLERNDEFMEDFNQSDIPEYQDELQEMLGEALSSSIRNNRREYESAMKQEYGMRDFSSYELSESIINDLKGKIEDDPEWVNMNNLQDYLYDSIDPNSVDFRDVEAITKRVMDELNLGDNATLQGEFLANKDNMLNSGNTTQRVINKVIFDQIQEAMEKGEEADPDRDKDDKNEETKPPLDYSDFNRSSGSTTSSSGGGSGSVDDKNDYSDHNSSMPRMPEDYGDSSGMDIPEDNFNDSEPDNIPPEPETPQDSSPSGGGSGGGGFDPSSSASTDANNSGSEASPESDSANFGESAIVGDDGSVYLPNEATSDTWTSNIESGSAEATRDQLTPEQQDEKWEELQDKYGDKYDIQMNEYGDALLIPKNQDEESPKPDDRDNNNDNGWGDLNGSVGGADLSGWDYDWTQGMDWWFDEFSDNDEYFEDTSEEDWGWDGSGGYEQNDWNDYDRYMA